MADIADLRHLTVENRALLDAVVARDEQLRIDPSVLHPHLFYPRCTVRVLLVADGGLDFGSADFGLRTFVKTLQGGSTLFVRYEVTLAHRRVRSGDPMLAGDASIARRITSFRFDDADHFGVDRYDQAWLFGIESAPGLADTELRALSEFMDAGGGVFATGDHAALGKAMGGEVPRVRSMRLWDSTPGVDEVSMGGHRRNDTNRRGHDAASTFDDQSDDVPQRILPRMYRTRVGAFEAVYPHPLLCGKDGVIDVMPDHPHEGECIAPSDLSANVTFAGATFQEYPAAIDGGPTPRPEVISTSTVLSGTTSGSKAATQGHSFGGISAYDGHRAGVGRVVTDATWHHFVNVNLVGQLSPPVGPPKNLGFLASATGQAHLEAIKNYYRNIAVWINPPHLIRCMNRRVLWDLVFHSRVVEAVATAYDVGLRKAHPTLLWHIGAQATDVLGRRTSACQRLRLVLDLVWERIPLDLWWRIDPWGPKVPERPDGPDPVPWFDPSPLLDMALGGALLAIRERFGDLEEVDEKTIDEVFDDTVEEGLRVGLARAREVARTAVGEFESVIAD